MKSKKKLKKKPQQFQLTTRLIFPHWHTQVERISAFRLSKQPEQLTDEVLHQLLLLLPHPLRPGRHPAPALIQHHPARGGGRAQRADIQLRLGTGSHHFTVTRNTASQPASQPTAQLLDSKYYIFKRIKAGNCPCQYVCCKSSARREHARHSSAEFLFRCISRSRRTGGWGGRKVLQCCGPATQHESAAGTRVKTTR